MVLNNDGGGIFSFLEQARVPLFERVFGTPHGLDLHTWADLYGIATTMIERASDLTELVRAGAGVRLIEARTDREDNVKTHRAIWQAVDAALESAG